MASSNYELNEDKSPGVVKTIGALSLVAASFGADPKAHAMQYSPDALPESTLKQTADRASARQSVVAEKYAKVADVKEVTQRWSKDQQLYVSGDIGIGEAELARLSEALKAHPNWTVYLTEKSEGTFYQDADGQQYFHNEAVEHALGKEVRNTQGFGEFRTADTGEPNGAIMYISFDRNADYRSVGYLGSEAYDSRGLGEDNWAGNLDEIAISRLKDGRRVYDAVIDSIEHLDSTREYRVAHPGIVKTATDFVSENIADIAKAAGAVLAAGATSLVLASRKRTISELLGSVAEHNTKFSDLAKVNERFLKEYQDLLATPEGRALRGDSEKISGDIAHYIKSNKELTEKGLLIAEGMSNNLTPDSLMGQAVVLASLDKTNEAKDILYNSEDVNSLRNIAAQVAEQQKVVAEFTSGLRNSMLHLSEVESKIESSLNTLERYAVDPKLSRNLSIKLEEAKAEWRELAARDPQNDPYSKYKDMLRLQDGIVYEIHSGHSQLEKYEALQADVERARLGMEASAKRIAELKGKADSSTGKLEELEEAHQSHQAQLAAVRTELSQAPSDDWLLRLAIYNQLFTDIGRNQKAAEKAYVSPGGQYYDSRPEPERSNYQSSSYDSSSGFSSSSFGSGFGSSSFGGGGSGFSSSNW